MTLESLKDAVGLLRHPVIWSVGLVMGGFLFATATIAVSGGVFYAEPLMLLLSLVIPFLAGGIYGTVRDEAFSAGAFVQSGKTYYFRILLPGLVIFFAAILTVFLLARPLALLGAGAAASMAPLLFGVLISIVFFTFFTVAVFEERTLESIRRNEFVMNNPHHPLLPDKRHHLHSAGLPALSGPRYHRQTRTAHQHEPHRNSGRCRYLALIDEDMDLSD